jgi:hypothetical protein
VEGNIEADSATTLSLPLAQQVGGIEVPKASLVIRAANNAPIVGQAENRIRLSGPA